MTRTHDETSTPGDPPGAAEAQSDQAHQAGEPAGRRELDSPPPGVPDDPAVCGYCGARFVDGELLALHRGLEHGSRLDEEEREAYAEAVADEREALRLFRLQALVALLVIYFGFVLVYAFVL